MQLIITYNSHNSVIRFILQDEDTKRQRYRELIDSYFEAKGDKNSFKNSMRKTVGAIVEQFFSIIVYYFDKYSEEEFHKRMNNEYILIDKKSGERFTCVGFDFIGDFKTFHKPKFIAAIMGVRANKLWFKLDEQKLQRICIGLLEAKEWNISEMEKDSIRQTIRRMINVIYHGVDSLRDFK